VAIRTIQTSKIADAIARMCISTCHELPSDFVKAVEAAIPMEHSPTGQEVLRQILENAEVARRDAIPMCQDTGSAVVFLEVGQDVHIVGGSLAEAVNDGVRRGYSEGFLRKSIVRHPLDRINTRDNTPAFIHTDIVPGAQLKITVAAKGGGSENMSRLAMLKPSQGEDGIVEFVIRAVAEAGPNSCPPLVIGVGIGGNFEMCALLSKRALMRPVGQPSPVERDDGLERTLLERVNATGVGPGGFGGTVTALAVHVLSMPTHIASLPVAVNTQCHAARHKEVLL
jgi:fumarate hydratase subunit alpha